MDHVKKQYPRAVHQVVIRHTRVGDFLMSGDSLLEMDGPSLEVVNLCDGCHTVQDIAEWAAREADEPVEEAYEGLIQFLDMLSGEGVIVYKDSPDPFNPVYCYDRPLSVIWEITYACNQRCRYCIAQAGTPDPDELSPQEIDRVLDELVELGIGLINITGGEPLLKMDTALHIARRASENGIDLELLTNGMLITSDVAQNIYDAGIRHAQVSLDCVRPEVHDNQRGVKGAWKKTVSGIRNLRDAGVNVMAAAVMTSENLQYFEETKQFLREIANVVKMGSVLPMGRGENSIFLLPPEDYLTFLKLRNTEEATLTDFIFCREKCSIGTTPVISPRGDVYPCMLTKYDELKLGNVRDTSIHAIYENSDLLQELFDWNVDKVDACHSCWNRYYCGGGCRGCAFAYHGTIYGNDPYQCAARKKFARELLVRGDPETRKALKHLIFLAKHDSGRG